jgi:opacity protein-like surface antigen
MRTKIVFLFGFIALMLTQVDAQSIHLGPQVGFYKASDADNGSVMGGVACRVKFTPVLGAEASINYRQETYANGALTVKSWPVMVTGLIYPIPFLYGAIGGGWYNVTYDFNQNMLPLFTDESTQRFGWHFGGGVELPVGPTMKLIGDIRYVFLDYDFKTIPGSGDPQSDFAVIMIGLLFGI